MHVSFVDAEPCMSFSQILYLTDLEQWSPHAVYQATRLFVSNLNAKLVRQPSSPMPCASMSGSRRCKWLFEERDPVCG